MTNGTKMSEIHQSWIFTFLLHNRKCLENVWHVLIHHWHKTHKIRLDIYTISISKIHTHTQKRTYLLVNKCVTSMSNTKIQDVHDSNIIVRLTK